MRIVVLNDNGDPIPDAKLGVSLPSAEPTFMTTESDGHAETRLSRAIHGRAEIYVAKLDPTAGLWWFHDTREMGLKAGDALEWKIRLPRPSDLEISLIDEGNNPRAGESLKIAFG
ncbi:MAG: hypothetical protein IT452_05720, partial [Planctomycetia bacterium]|nr:hypothetical protein [Planctomycetia bacterium]